MPSWRDLRRFCERDGWTLYRDTDHYYYRKINDDGSFRQTKVSKGAGEIGPGLWRDILKHQLCITKEYFNSKI